MLWAVCLAVTLLSYSEVIATTDAQKNAEIGIGSHISEVADPAVRLALGAPERRLKVDDVSAEEVDNGGKHQTELVNQNITTMHGCTCKENSSMYGPDEYIFDKTYSHSGCERASFGIYNYKYVDLPWCETTNPLCPGALDHGFDYCGDITCPEHSFTDSCECLPGYEVSESRDACVPAIPASAAEQAALMSAFMVNSASTDLWQRTLGWVADLNPCHHDLAHPFTPQWVGVYCWRGRVVKINLSPLNVRPFNSYFNLEPLPGFMLSSSIGELSEVNTLYFALADLSGTLPESLHRLTALRQLYLFDTLLSGTLPMLNSLADVMIFGTMLSGTLPPLAGTHDPLAHQTRISGTVPRGLTDVQTLTLSTTRLSGTLPNAQWTTICSVHLMWRTQEYQVHWHLRSHLTRTYCS